MVMVMVPRMQERRRLLQDQRLRGQHRRGQRLQDQHRRGQRLQGQRLQDQRLQDQRLQDRDQTQDQDQIQDRDQVTLALCRHLLCRLNQHQFISMM